MSFLSIQGKSTVMVLVLGHHPEVRSFLSVLLWLGGLRVSLEERMRRCPTISHWQITAVLWQARDGGIPFFAFVFDM